MTPAAETVDVVRRFGTFTAVDRVAMEVGPGEVVGLLGANGAGKTTLIRMLLGILPASEGRVRLFGHPPSRRVRRRIGYMPQSLGLYEDLTVGENLAFRAAAFGVPRPPLSAALVEVRDRQVGDLPLGLRRRAAFACALANHPDLLVLDEPTSGVDPLGRARLWDTIREAAEGGAAVLVTTHHMDESAQCDRLVVMAAGRVAATGTVAAIIHGQTAVEVRAERWDRAFAALDGRFSVVLSGRSVRVPAGDPSAVEAALREAGVDAEVRTVPATFEEAFVVLSAVRGGGDA